VNVFTTLNNIDIDYLFIVLFVF